ncbi:MAG TPA: BMP family ABC transporter substrate-binding protein, partial [Rectinemataceae bacterium]|nr:BMP family ABC transporter substrate-binding protein [Rectinemataceae bacterium]
MRYRSSALILAMALLSASALFGAPGPKVCVFVPGVVSGSPTYEQLVAGAKRAVDEVPGASLKVVEAGFNQADWLDKLSALAAT